MRAQRAGVGVERGELNAAPTPGYAPLLPPGRRAGVEHALAVGQVEAGAARCAPASCTETSPLVEPGQALDRHRPLEQQRLRRRACARAMPAASRRCLIGGDAGPPAVHAQAHRRMDVAGGQHRLPLRRVRGAHEVDPPCAGADSAPRHRPGCAPRASPARAGSARSTRVDIALGVPALEQRRRRAPPGRPRCSRRSGRTPARKASTRAAPRPARSALAAARELAHDRLHAAVAAQRAVRKIDQRGARGFASRLGAALELRGEAAAGGDALHHRAPRPASAAASGAHPKRAPPATGWPRRNSPRAQAACRRRAAAPMTQARLRRRRRPARDPRSSTAPGAPLERRRTRARQILTVSPCEHGVGARDRTESAHRALELRRRTASSRARLALSILRRVGRARCRLRHGVARGRLRHRQASATIDLRAERGELVVQGAGVVVGRDRQRLPATAPGRYRARRPSA